MVLQPEVVTFTVAWFAVGSGRVNAVLAAASSGHRSRYRVPVTGLMISVMNSAAISLQVSGICPAGDTQRCLESAVP